MIPSANRLAHEKSPYLLQHASNPVDWYPWGEEAFARARAEDRPVFLSIGYATCHWCHVMERESFEDPEVAALLNRTFVCVKVDREERPDVDQVYMTVCQMLTGAGGWPLTVIMTPDRTPFFAATYLPKQTRWGRVGLVELVPRLAAAWRERRGELLASAAELLGHLRSTSGAASRASLDPDLVERGFAELEARFDRGHGGFGAAPKFHAPHNLVFLIRYWQRSGNREALEMAEQTLAAMRRGGVYDHLGFGFHRYSTDRDWLVPHFEKMLYDQATVVLAATEAFLATGQGAHGRIVREVLTYVLRDLTSPEGAFSSAEDADSEGEEGRFYLWTRREIHDVLGPDLAELACRLWTVAEEGNFSDETSGSPSGANVLHRRGALAVDPGLVEEARRRLLEARERRVRPLRDDKVLADWNGLMAAARARAGRVLRDPAWVEAARRSVDFVLARMRDPEGRLLHRWRDGEAAIGAFLDDHAFLTWALLELYDATLEPLHLERAVALQEETIERFWDRDGGGFFLTPEEGEQLLVRPKEVYDGAIPSGNSVAAANLVRLGRLTGRVDLTERARQVTLAFARDLERRPAAHTHLLSALLELAGDPLEVVVAGNPASPDTERLVETYRAQAPPGSVLLLVPDGPSGDVIRRLARFTADHRPVGGRPAAYVCRSFACQLPVTEPAALAALLRP
jgi:uncharacterized protein YyaL (SSP411 family)